MSQAEFIATLASGAAFGALISGTVQFVLAHRQRRWDRADRLAQRRREAYDAYLRHVMTTLPDFWASWIVTGNAWDFAREHERAQAHLRVDAMLVASTAVREGLNSVQAAIVEFGESTSSVKPLEGTDVISDVQHVWEHVVMPKVRALAAIMAEEING